MTTLFGEFRESKDNIISNHRIFMAKLYICKCKLERNETIISII